jgi:hypothetical protein
VNVEHRHPKAQNPLIPTEFRVRVALLIGLWVFPLLWILFIHYAYGIRSPNVEMVVWDRLVDDENRLSIARLYLPFLIFAIWFSGFQILAINALFAERIGAAKRLAVFHLGGIVVFLLAVRGMVAPYSWMFPPILAFSVLVALEPKILGFSRYHVPALYIVYGVLGVNCISAGIAFFHFSSYASVISINCGAFVLFFFLWRLVAFIVEHHVPFMRADGRKSRHRILVGSNADGCGLDDITESINIRKAFSLRLYYLDRPLSLDRNGDGTRSVWVTKQWIANCPLSAIDALRSVLLDHCRNHTALLLFNPENDAVWDTNTELDWPRRRVAILFQRIKRQSPTAGIGRQQLMEKLPALLTELQNEKTAWPAPTNPEDLDSLPYPFAWLLFDLRRSTSSDDRFYLFSSLFESVIHTIGVFCITHGVIATLADPAFLALSDKIDRSPALGDWLQAVEVYVRHEPQSQLTSTLQEKRIDSEISDAIKHCKTVFGLQDTTRIRNAMDFLWFLIHLRNQTIGHGAFIYRVPQEIDGALVSLTQVLCELLAEMGLSIRLGNDSDEGSILHGMDPDLPPVLSRKPMQIAIGFQGTPLVRTNYLRYRPDKHDLFHYNGLFDKQSEWKSYLSGDYLTETIQSGGPG